MGELDKAEQACAPLNSDLNLSFSLLKVAWWRRSRGDLARAEQLFEAVQNIYYVTLQHAAEIPGPGQDYIEAKLEVLRENLKEFGVTMSGAGYNGLTKGMAFTRQTMVA